MKLIGELEKELVDIENEIERLRYEFEESIAELNSEMRIIMEEIHYLETGEED